ncbi:MAG TPA: hypothetical protein VFI92_04560 [Steroidobacteraceae bacterium]|nr:hypothetical protein [Steroidobacteraceae bacterium]
MAHAIAHRILAILTLSAVATLAPARAETAGVVVSIAKRAALTSQGVVVLDVRVTCGPFDGVEEFQEALAGAAQPRTGAEAEGGIDGYVTCDGVERTYTAHLSSFTETSFKHGPGVASASVFVCTLVGDEQACYHGGQGRRVILTGRRAP